MGRGILPQQIRNPFYPIPEINCESAYGDDSGKFGQLSPPSV
jgi:hypothetical protein